MPKTRTIVAINNPKTGEALAAGAEVELDDEAYRELRDSGKVEASEQEVKEHATPEAQGNYGARTGRSNVGEAEAPTAVNAPEEEDEDHPHGGPPGQTGDHPQGGPPGQTGDHPQGGPPGQQPQPEPRSEKKK